MFSIQEEYRNKIQEVYDTFLENLESGQEPDLRVHQVYFGKSLAAPILQRQREVAPEIHHPQHIFRSVRRVASLLDRQLDPKEKQDHLISSTLTIFHAIRKTILSKLDFYSKRSQN